jgi:hypothetical protein
MLRESARTIVRCCSRGARTHAARVLSNDDSATRQLQTALRLLDSEWSQQGKAGQTRPRSEKLLSAHDLRAISNSTEHVKSERQKGGE